MAYRTGIAQGDAVRDGAAACDEAVRNGGLTMIAAVARVATGVGVCGARLEAWSAVTTSRVRRGVEGMKAPTTKTSSGMKATAVETATSATVEAAATATARAGYVCERQYHDCARQDPSERQPNPFAVRSSQHVFLHLN